MAGIPNPLREVHQQAGAEFQGYGEVEIVSTFGEPPAEYAAVRKGCAMMDLPHRGLVELTGRDRLTFLNNLVSNQTFDKEKKTGLAAGQQVYAFLLNAKSGRIITDVTVIERGDRTWLEVEARLVDAVIAELNRYLFAEQVKIASLVGTHHQIALYGPGAGSVLTEYAADLPVWRDEFLAGSVVVMPIAEARRVWMELLTRFGGGEDLGRRRLRPIGWAIFNAARIEAGRPLFGVDFDNTVLPHETGPLLDRAVSFTKGCYPGQEIVARMHARGGTARNIVGIRMEGDALPIAGAKIYDAAGNEVGGVTSSTISPVLSNAAIALGIVKRPHFNVGTSVTIPAEGEMRKANVVELPFVKSEVGA